MKRTLVFALCLLAVSGQVLADTSVQRRSITGKDVQNGAESCLYGFNFVYMCASIFSDERYIPVGGSV